MKKYKIGEHVLFSFEFYDFEDGDETAIVLRCTVVGKHKHAPFLYLLQIDDEQYPQIVDEWIHKFTINGFEHIKDINKERYFSCYEDYLTVDKTYYDDIFADQLSIDVLSVL